MLMSLPTSIEGRSDGDSDARTEADAKGDARASPDEQPDYQSDGCAERNTEGDAAVFGVRGTRIAVGHQRSVLDRLFAHQGHTSPRPGKDALISAIDR
jgi:hypothetical protein